MYRHYKDMFMRQISPTLYKVKCEHEKVILDVMNSNLTKMKILFQAPLASNPMTTEQTTQFANKDHEMQLKTLEKANM